MTKPKPDELEAVEVYWLDAHGGSFVSPASGWGKLGPEHTSAEVMRSVGLLVNQGKEGMLLCLTYSNRGEVDSYIFIPRGCITEVSYLNEGE